MRYTFFINSLSFILVFFASFAIAASPDRFLSATRQNDETFESARSRAHRDAGVPKDINASSAESLATSFDSLSTSSVTEVDDVEKVFSTIRDERFLEQSSMPGFPRRVSWLYPYDGCYTRAVLTGKLAEEAGYTRPRSLFIFGNLTVKTPNSPEGQVMWWYHVSSVVADSKGNLFILDPAIEHTKPLAIKDWILTMVPDLTKATFSICHPRTFDPTADCINGTATADTNAEMLQSSYFLSAEWRNLVSLDRDPNKELGDEPPWLAPHP